MCGVEQYKKWLERKNASDAVKVQKSPQQNSSITIGLTQTTNSAGCTETDAMLATPGAAFFQTEYAKVTNKEGNRSYCYCCI